MAFSNLLIIREHEIFQPRDANFVMCIWLETLVKHRNEALSMSFMQSNSSELDVNINNNTNLNTLKQRHQHGQTTFINSLSNKN